MAKRLRLKKKVWVSLIGIIVLFIGIIVGINKYKEYLYHQTNEYKLTTVGYTLDESKLIIEKLNDDNETYFIENEKNDFLIDLIKETYFLEKNLYDYIDYKNDNKNTTIKDVISIVNVHANKPWYDDGTITDTDMTKEYLILVNKFYKLSSEYEPEDLKSINLSYAYDNNRVREVVNDAFVDMASTAREEGIKLIANSSYRTYTRQEEMYKELYYSKGLTYADNYAARAGHSEHQTGLAIDVFSLDSTTTEDFDQSEAFKWLSNNAHKYGFILRYPKDKENITGYAYESWHYRYVGVDVATEIYNLGITFDEYYAYYLEK